MTHFMHMRSDIGPKKSFPSLSALFPSIPSSNMKYTKSKEFNNNENMLKN